MINNDLFSQLGTTSQRALMRRKKRFGKPYSYHPRGNLLARLARENETTVEQVYADLMQLRSELLQLRE